MRFAFISLFLIFFVCYGLDAQPGQGHLLWQAKEIKMPAVHQKNGVKIFNIPVNTKPALPAIRTIPPLFNYPVLPADYYSGNLGWVCRQEWKLEKKTRLPLRFRLGSKEQVDWLEGKNLDQH